MNKQEYLWVAYQIVTGEKVLVGLDDHLSYVCIGIDAKGNLLLSRPFELDLENPSKSTTIAVHFSECHLFECYSAQVGDFSTDWFINHQEDKPFSLVWALKLTTVDNTPEKVLDKHYSPLVDNIYIYSDNTARLALDSFVMWTVSLLDERALSDRIVFDLQS